jgi:putative ubiquitin-RnfH superfamily antitoxin RatB of RatAB toxin-antitoxin module
VIYVRIEVVIAQRDRQRVVEIVLPDSTTVGEALLRVAGTAGFDGVDLNEAPIGIFGRLVERSQRLNEGDRVEIYRSLAIDPMTARRRRARGEVSRRAAD